MNTLTDFINAAGGAAGGVLGALNQPKTVVNNAPAPSPAPMEKIGPKEIALFADRIDIAEELTRLRSHLDQLAQLSRADDPVGRKAEFILQEIGREIHTIGGKANDLEIARAVIEFKNELERIREQAQNVE